MSSGPPSESSEGGPFLWVGSAPRPGLQALERALDGGTVLAESQPQVRARLADLTVAVEGAERDRDHAGLLRQALAQRGGVVLPESAASATTKVPASGPPNPEPNPPRPDRGPSPPSALSAADP